MSSAEFNGNVDRSKDSSLAPSNIWEKFFPLATSIDDSPVKFISDLGKKREKSSTPDVLRPETSISDVLLKSRMRRAKFVSL